MKARAVKLIRNALISIVVLLVLFLGGGVMYTWFMGQKGVESAAVATPVEAKPAPVIKPTKPAANARVGAAVHMLTSPVPPGSNASITVKTLATAKCTIVVEYNKVASKDSDLVAKTADEYGMVSWTWTVGESVPLGKWPVKVTCAYNKSSAMVQGDLVVAKPN